MRFGNIILILAATLLCTPGSARADGKLTEAEKLYRAGEWEKSRQVYADILSGPDASRLPADFFYNLGTVSLRSGQPGAAYAYLLKALAGKPWDADIFHNLRMAREKLAPAAQAIQPADWISSWPLLGHFLPWVFWLIPCLVGAALLQWSVTAGKPRLQIYLWSGVTATLVVLAVIGYGQSTGAVAVFVKAGQVKSGPGTSFPDIVNLEAGAAVSVEDFRDGWKKIRFLGADQQEAVGWIEATSILDLR